ncbi:glyoxylate reductase (NADP(+)) [Flavobacteriaceae bacterium UJ101]|nr:glyoxylate reductase (NADP(+)) [Flavobacteriaceae bacterium UJ101]
MAIVLISQHPNSSKWIHLLKSFNKNLDLRIYPFDSDREEVDYALTWKPPLGALKNYPNLKAIASLRAGVDDLLKDPDLPKIPITRIIDPKVAQSMGYYLLGTIMNYFCHLTSYKERQEQKVWEQRPNIIADNLTVGIMGLGAIGKEVALKLNSIGLNVIGWAKSKKEISNINCFQGEKEFYSFLNQSNILICLLPLTKETKGILNKKTFQQLPKGAHIINVARGEHLEEDHLIEMLNNNHLSGATLDVFKQEPLDPSHPFWEHDKITITPHVSSLSNPNIVIPQVLKNYELLKQNKPLNNIISLEKGY